MNLKEMKSEELLIQTKSLVKEEQRITLEILRYLQEIERRRLYAERGYSSLYDFATKYLGYESGAAWRRIDSMRLLKTNPEVEKKIEDGSISLTVAAQAQTFFRKQNIKTAEEKTEVLSLLENKSTREVERALREISPESIPQGRVRALTGEVSELRVMMDQETLDGWNDLLALMSHKNPKMDYGELLKYLVKLGKEKLAPKPLKHNCSENQKSLPAQEARHRCEGPEGRGRIRAAKVRPARSYISVNLKREVWQQAQSQCSYVDPLTKRKCTSKHFLEIDHIKPIAIGGDNQPENLRLLCREHNQLMALKNQLMAFRNLGEQVAQKNMGQMVMRI